MSFEEFKPLNEESLVEYINATPSLSSRLGDKFIAIISLLSLRTWLKLKQRAKAMSFEEFKPLNEESLVEYINATPSLSSRLGDKYDDLMIKEVGDHHRIRLYLKSSLLGVFPENQFP
ncbi:hypothetical protein Bca52824_080521 [Brassica carinata]|uniref:Uncharacterized protein n=2 Tax=Brassica TaxID=3705 RepID=A0A8X7PFL4_BRACI|nr:hypothetical protein Bca52824_080521 [Brassica carinata]